MATIRRRPAIWEFYRLKNAKRVGGRAEGSVGSFAYPFGAVSAEAVNSVTAAGFDIGVTCEPRALRTREHRLRIPRVVAREESGAELGTRMSDLR
jgi:hypothetical protein